MAGIRLSEKYGVNPSMGVCYLCTKDDGTIVLPGIVNRKDDRGVVVERDVEAPRRACWSKEPCDSCKGLMQEGIILISVKNGESGDDPYRTGGWCVIKEEAAKRWLMGPLLENVLRTRVCFVPDQVWDQAGLPRSQPPGEMVQVHPHLPEVEKDKPIRVLDDIADKLGFTAKNFSSDSYLWWDGTHLLVSFIAARHKKGGAFRHFVDMCQSYKLPLRVPNATAIMQGILTRWGWTSSEEISGATDAVPGDPVTVWDPPKEGPWTGKKEKTT